MTAPTRPFATSTFRLAVTTIALSLLAAAAVVVVLLWRTNDLLSRQSLDAIAAEAASLLGEGRSLDVLRLAQLVGERGRQPGSGLYLLLDGRGGRLAGNLPVTPEAAVTAAGGTFSYHRTGDAAGSGRLAVALPYRTASGHTLLVGRDIEELRLLTGNIRRLFFWGFLTLTLLGLAGGWWVSRSLLGRIEAVTATSRSIMAGDLSRRVGVNGSNDEIDRLSISLNAMLERIEQLMDGLREVSDNIAHDLKTPLTRLRNRTEAALRDARGGPAWREGLERNLEEADELIKTFNALLSIARLEAGVPREGLERVDLSAVARDVAELYEPTAEEAGLVLRIEADRPVPVRANRQLLGQAVANLIDNAIKYGGPQTPRALDAHAEPGTVTLRVAQRGDGAEISVADRGPGISAEDREKVLKRFVRLEKSRSQPGSGLGLSLVAAVARLHGGSVRLEDNAPGLRVVVTIPAEPASEMGRGETAPAAGVEPRNGRSLLRLQSRTGIAR